MFKFRNSITKFVRRKITSAAQPSLALKKLYCPVNKEEGD